MKAVRHNITIDLGRDYLETFEFFEDDGVTPIDLTGKSYKGQIRENTSHTSAPSPEPKGFSQARQRRRPGP